MRAKTTPSWDINLSRQQQRLCVTISVTFVLFLLSVYLVHITSSSGHVLHPTAPQTNLQSETVHAPPQKALAKDTPLPTSTLPSVKLGLVICTSSDTHSRATTALNTWASQGHLSSSIPSSEQSNSWIKPVIVTDKWVPTVDTDEDDLRHYTIQEVYVDPAWAVPKKTDIQLGMTAGWWLAGVRMLQAVKVAVDSMPEANFFWIGDDDAYLMTHNIVNWLQKNETRQQLEAGILFGHWYLSWPSILRNGEQFTFLHGGPGFILSKASALKMTDASLWETCLSDTRYFPGDMAVAYCALEAGLDMKNHDGFHSESFFKTCGSTDGNWMKTPLLPNENFAYHKVSELESKFLYGLMGGQSYK